MRYDRGNTPEYWNEYWGGRGRTETYARRSVLSWIDQLKPTAVLDIGCGTGGTLLRIKHPCIRVGVDISEVAIKKLVAGGVEGHVMSAYDVDQLGRRFDFIFANHLLEHLDLDFLFLEKLRKIVVSPGTIFIAVPNNMSTPEDTDKHSHVYDEPALRKLMTDVYGNCHTHIIGNHLFGVSQL